MLITNPNTPMHVTLKRNKTGRDFLVGDVHGMYDVLMKELERLRFDPAADRLIATGDLVDRGPKSKKTLKLLREDWFFSVRGNHEEMLLGTGKDARRRHLRYGGEWTENLRPEKLIEYQELAASMPHAITLKMGDGVKIGICHAEWPGKDWALVDKALAKHVLREQMIWGRKRIRSGRKQIDKTANLLVHGHTPVRVPMRLGNALFLDTGCVYNGTLTIMEARQALEYGPARMIA